MRTCPQRLLKSHINMFMMDQLHEAVQNYKKEVNSLLSETNFNIFEDIILPKYSTLILLRHVHKEDWNTKKSDNQFTSTSLDQSEPVRIARSDQPDRTSQFGPPVRTTKRNDSISLFPQPLKAHEYPLEIL